MSEPKGAAEITSIVFYLFLVPYFPDPGNVNPQGWLPPCRPFGRRWQCQLNSYTHTRPEKHVRAVGECFKGGAGIISISTADGRRYTQINVISEFKSNFMDRNTKESAFSRNICVHQRLSAVQKNT